MIEKIQWAKDNFLNIIQIVTLVVVAAELITRLTPTKTDDGAVKRLGEQLDKLLTFLKVPNLRRQIKEGSDLNGIDDGPGTEMGSGSGGTAGPGLPSGTKEPTDGGRGE
jgi:hypothetical protein